MLVKLPATHNWTSSHTHQPHPLLTHQPHTQCNLLTLRTAEKTVQYTPVDLHWKWYPRMRLESSTPGCLAWATQKPLLQWNETQWEEATARVKCGHPCSPGSAIHSWQVRCRLSLWPASCRGLQTEHIISEWVLETVYGGLREGEGVVRKVDTNMWLSHDYYETKIMWLLWGCHVTIMWPSCDSCEVLMWPSCDSCVM